MPGRVVSSRCLDSIHLFIFKMIITEHLFFFYPGTMRDQGNLVVRKTDVFLFFMDLFIPVREVMY